MSALGQGYVGVLLEHAYKNWMYPNHFLSRILLAYKSYLYKSILKFQKYEQTKCEIDIYIYIS